jgi:2,4-dienoyl-CoA reductase-like NADH-dependent reductase (Old Yellow Enzyme family)
LNCSWAAGHHGRDRIQLAAGAVQIRGTALQAAEGFGEEIAQGIGGHRQFAQFILTAAGHALGEFAVAQLRHVIDQLRIGSTRLRLISHRLNRPISAPTPASR